jgi:hypothetical protein
MKNNKSPLFLPFLIYGIGLAVGLILIAISTWADLEATFYGFPRQANAGLGGFNCPVLMTRDETGTISLVVANTTTSRVSPSIKTMISTPGLLEEYTERVVIEPDQSEEFEWQVDVDNVDLERFIFAKALIFAAYPLPTRETTCGIFVLNAPGSGRSIMPLLVMFSLACAGWGFFAMYKLRETNKWVAKNLGALAFMLVLLIIGFFSILKGWWMLSILILIVVLLMFIILPSSALLSERRR